MRLAPSLHRVGSDLVNVYYVEDDTGVTVIDAGLPGQWDELVTELGRNGRSLDDVRGLILTHGDPDHIGFAERLRSERGVPIYVHQSDAGRARGEIDKKLEWGKIKVLPTLRFLIYGARHGGLRQHPLTEVVGIDGERTLDLPGSPRVIHTPGHTPGSVSYYFASVGAVFVGDALTTRHVLTGEQGPAPAPFTLDRAQALVSLSQLRDLGAIWVLPGHGPPWSGGVAEAVTLVEAAASAAG